MINLKDAKEVRKKVEQVKKKRKERKHLESDNCRLAKKLVRIAIGFEYVACTILLLSLQVIQLNEEHDELKNTIIDQQNTIYNLSLKMVNETKVEAKYQAVTYIKEENKKINLSESDRELLAKLLYHEARGESLECQKAVASVVINRLNSKKWGNTLHDVIYARNQFEPVARGLINGTKPLDKQYEAIDYVLENGVTVPEDVMYFRADYYFTWAKPYKSIDNTYFSI